MIGPSSRRDGPGRLMSLWDLMHVFNCFGLVSHISILARAQVNCEAGRRLGMGHQFLEKDSYDSIAKEISALLDFCINHELKAAQRKVALSQLQFEHAAKSLDASAIATELRNVYEAVLFNTHDVKFLYVDKDRANYVDNPGALFEQDVREAFPNAVPDMKEAGNCLAADCNTAAVFHLMRVVEWGLRALAGHLGFTQMVAKQKANGRQIYAPVEYLEWERILNQLHDRVDERIEAMPRGPEKQAAQQFYYPLLQEIAGIRDAWRNHVMHARRDYLAQDADAVLKHVQRLMAKLATQVREA